MKSRCGEFPALLAALVVFGILAASVIVAHSDEKTDLGLCQFDFGCACPTATATPPESGGENSMLFFNSQANDFHYPSLNYMHTESTCVNLPLDDGCAEVENAQILTPPEDLWFDRMMVHSISHGGGWRTVYFDVAGAATSILALLPPNINDGQDIDNELLVPGLSRITVGTAPYGGTDVCNELYVTLRVRDEAKNPYDGLLSFGGRGQAGDGDYCGPSEGKDWSDPAKCTESDPDHASWPMPCTGIARWFTVALEEPIAADTTETFTVYRADVDEDMPWVIGPLAEGTSSGYALCATPTVGEGTPTPTPGGCDVTFGDDLAIRVNRTGAAQNIYRNFLLTFDGCGAIQVDMTNNPSDLDTNFYGLRHYGLVALTTTYLWYTLADEATLRNLIFQRSQVVPGGAGSQTGAICGRANLGAPVCGGATCEIGEGKSECTDTVNHIDTLFQGTTAGQVEVCNAAQSCSGISKVAWEVTRRYTPTPG